MFSCKWLRMLKGICGKYPWNCDMYILLSMRNLAFKSRCPYREAQADFRSCRKAITDRACWRWCRNVFSAINSTGDQFSGKSLSLRGLRTSSFYSALICIIKSWKTPSDSFLIFTNVFSLFCWNTRSFLSSWVRSYQSDPVRALFLIIPAVWSSYHESPRFEIC